MAINAQIGKLSKEIKISKKNQVEKLKLKSIFNKKKQSNLKKKNKE